MSTGSALATRKMRSLRHFSKSMKDYSGMDTAIGGFVVVVVIFSSVIG